MQDPAAPPDTAGRAIISRPIDLLCVGGASAILSCLLLVLPLPSVGMISATGVICIQMLFNWPHFMSSYRLLYADRATVLKYPTASIYLPALLALYSVFALWVWPVHPVHGLVLQWVGVLYLARHYTGQTWGMMASFAYVEKISFTPRERTWVRSGLLLIMLWHISWAAASLAPMTSAPLVKPTAEVYRWMTVVAAISLLLGLVGLVSMTRRLGRLPPARVLVPWVTLYLWYALLAKDPAAAVLVQAGHALQYLIFPVRVELNRQQTTSPARLVGMHMATWMLTSFAVFLGLPAIYNLFYKGAGGQLSMQETAPALVGSFIAIHHYFVDGTLYKLRNPEVRRALFSHLQPAAPQVAAAA